MPIGGFIRLVVMALAETGGARNIGIAAVRISAAVLCAISLIVLATAAIGCAVAALWIYATPYVGPDGAPLVAAGALLAVCLVLALVARGLLRRKRTASRSTAGPEVLLADATRLFKQHKESVLLAALIAGMVAANGSREP
jgi:membrane protein implicated in regulation of membrane protease activity